MKKVFNLFVFALLLIACNDDDSNEILHNLSVEVSSKEAISSYSIFHITVTDLQSGNGYQENLDAKEKAFFLLSERSYKIISQNIISGVETGAKDEFYHKVLPSSVDKSSILVDATMYGGLREQFVKRKVIVDKTANATVQDISDSANDFELIVGGQKSYPHPYKTPMYNIGDYLI